MSRKAVLLVRLLIFIFPCIEGGARLNDYIGDYETLDYSPTEIHHKHLRAKRWTGEPSHGPTVDLKLSTPSKQFHLRLKRESSVFSENIQLDGDAAPEDELDTSHLYTGHVKGVPDSHVFGSIQNGVFDGQIITPTETFFVERANKYSAHLPSTNASLHSVIYSGNDVQDPYDHLRTGHAKGCGITDEVMAWMDTIQNSAREDEIPLPELKHPKSKPFQREGPTAEALRASLGGEEEAYFKYTREPNAVHYLLQNGSYPRGSSISTGTGGSVEFFNRGRRALPSLNSRTTCTLSIQTDPLLWKHIADQEKTNDETKIREEILSLIAQHVKAVNHIYSNTLFDGKQAYKNIRFEVQRIKIDTDKACRTDYKGEKNLFCIENIDVSNFLNLHSLTDHHVFCLAYVFTYRDFTGGTLGLAWVASASGASGGVCETYKTYTETIGGVYQSTRRSLNTGIITFVNYNSRVPPKVSQLTLAHEIGHNFGSPHDYPNKCRPGGSDGNFIMFASATSGDRPNNSKFSDCSVKNISSVLDAILYDQKKSNCFISTNGTFCGNKIVEEGEECDCGYNYEECLEECCYPRQINQSDILRNPLAQGCRRKPTAQCSPSEGPCCDSRTCSFVSSRNSQLCKHETECSLNSSCNGTTATCPNPISRRDIQTTCNDGTQVCQGGECRGSICLKFGLQECFLSSVDKSVDKRKLCDLACLDKSGKCKSTAELNLPGLTRGLSLRPGAPCDNFQGYCDVFLKCRAVDAEGPLARLKNLLFNKETLLNIAQWVTDWWWAVLLIGVGFIIVMGAFIKCCAVHTPSSNPKKAPARRIGDTLRRPMNTLRRHRNANYRATSSAASASNGSSAPSAHSAPPPPYTSVVQPPGPGPTAPRPHGFGENRGPNRVRNNPGAAPSSSRPSPAGVNSRAGYQVPKKSQAQHRV